MKKYLLLLALIGLALLAFSAVADEAEAYDYKVTGVHLYNSDGVTDHNGSPFTTVTLALNHALSHNNTATYVPAGTYTLNNHVYFASGTTLYGDGNSTVFHSLYPGRGTPDGNYLYINGASNVVMHDFKMTGYVTIYCYGPTGATCGNWSFTDIHATQNGKWGEAGFWVRVAVGGVIDQISYLRCTVKDSANWGFLLHGFEPTTYPGTSLIKHVTYTDCEASRCGIPIDYDGTPYIPSQNNQHFWGPGFCLVELTTVQDITCLRCRADDNWASGFHIEYGAKPVRVQMIDCTANGNGHMYHYAGASRVNGVIQFATGAIIVEPPKKDGVIVLKYGFGFRVHPYNVGWPGGVVPGSQGLVAGGCAMIRCTGDNWNGVSGNYLGMSAITANFGDFGGVPRIRADGTTESHASITSWDMKIWISSVNGSASTGTFYPAGAPTAASDLIYCAGGSQRNNLVDTFYHTRHTGSWFNIYTGTLTYQTPVIPPTVAPVLSATWIHSIAEDHQYSVTVTSDQSVFWVVSGASFLTIQNGVVSGVPTDLDVGTYTVRVTASNSNGVGYSNASLTVTNIAPIFTSTPVTSSASSSHYEYQVLVTDSAVLSFSSDNEALEIDPTGLIHGTVHASGLIHNSVMANDQHGGLAWQNWTIEVTSESEGSDDGSDDNTPDPGTTHKAVVPGGEVGVKTGISRVGFAAIAGGLMVTLAGAFIVMNGTKKPGKGRK